MSEFSIAIQFNYILVRVDDAGIAELHAHLPAFGVNHTQVIAPGKQFIWQDTRTFIAVQSINSPEPIRVRLVISHHPQGILLIEEFQAPASNLWCINPYQTTSPSTALLQGSDHLLLLDWGDNHITAKAFQIPQSPGAERGPRLELPNNPSG